MSRVSPAQQCEIAEICRAAEAHHPQRVHEQWPYDCCDLTSAALLPVLASLYPQLNLRLASGYVKHEDRAAVTFGRKASGHVWIEATCDGTVIDPTWAQFTPWDCRIGSVARVFSAQQAQQHGFVRHSYVSEATVAHWASAPPASYEVELAA